jgi:hypothetical protein
MEFRTELSPQNLDFNLTHRDKIMMLGSCFTEHIASSLTRFRFPVFSNSHGIVFHPIPLAKALSECILNREYHIDDLIKSNENWVSLNHHGKFSSLKSEETLERINNVIGEGAHFVKEASTLVITFGTAIGYQYLETSQIAANCHKLHSNSFEKKRSEISDIVSEWNNVLSQLLVVNPKIKVIFTVSPVRHLREGFEENQKSKATLLLAIEKIQKSFPGVCFYFPSYEILMDDLRDYRFYEADMIHPNTQAIEYIREKFFASILSQRALELCRLMESHLRKLEHRSISETLEQKERRIVDANEAIRHILLKS